MEVEIVYASETTQQLLSLSVQPGCTVQQAIDQSGLLTVFPEIDLKPNSVGIWAEKRPLDTVLIPGDRVEIYRPLLMSPTEARKLRAQRKGAS